MAGFGKVCEVADMDLLSFQCASRCLVRTRERENKEPAAPTPAPSAPMPKGRMTLDQQNMALLSRIKVGKRG